MDFLYLQDLDAACNSLIGLPNHLEVLSTLDFLSVAGNQLRALPASFTLPRSLRWLDVSDNQLQQLPRAVGELQDLQVRDIRIQGVQAVMYVFCLLCA